MANGSTGSYFKPGIPGGGRSQESEFKQRVDSGSCILDSGQNVIFHLKLIVVQPGDSGETKHKEFGYIPNPTASVSNSSGLAFVQVIQFQLNQGDFAVPI
jgi:hypothetical protein